MSWFTHYPLVLLGIFVCYAFDYLLLCCLYRPPTSAIATSLKVHLPSSFLHPYNLTELQALAEALKNATVDGHQDWVNNALSLTLFIRQILPSTGLFYVEILTGHVYGLVRGLFTVWFLEITGAITCYLLASSTRQQRESNSWGKKLWAMAQKGLAIVIERGPVRVRVEPPQLLDLLLKKTPPGAYRTCYVPTIRTHLFASLLFSLLRSLALAPNWLLNSLAIELDFSFAEFLLSVQLGALPRVYYSMMIGTKLLTRTEEVDEDDYGLFYVIIASFSLLQGILMVLALRWDPNVQLEKEEISGQESGSVKSEDQVSVSSCSSTGSSSSSESTQLESQKISN